MNLALIQNLDFDHSSAPRPPLDFSLYLRLASSKSYWACYFFPFRLIRPVKHNLIVLQMCPNIATKIAMMKQQVPSSAKGMKHMFAAIPKQKPRRVNKSYSGPRCPSFFALSLHKTAPMIGMLKTSQNGYMMTMSIKPMISLNRPTINLLSL